MIRKLAPLASAAWRGAIVLFTIEIAIVSALRYFTGSQPPPPPILANGFAHPFLLLHVASGVTALLVAPLQFVGRGLARPGFHRLTGRVYLLACALGAPSGFMLALGSTAGPVTQIGFAIPALLWAAFTWLGWRAVVERRFAAHRDWMLRSYAITATGITLRLMLPASALLGFDFLPAYRVISWLAWTTNLALFEYVIRRVRTAATGGLALAAA
ncbi:MAG TPA: DUF2306 domain-containing protein [Allosphingosinicella sp.]|nr:DUF2306 domain-containing protein [Allosphingosinicella sp.]